ncbi:zinc-binding alcohol dehydrogenase-like protein [Penicillium waksmanii]|uniref:zinc-binding alcohol dehydrogenase-like protein n=1 Tax=Penicillium waksmanii TaxID=69791 RepID=UPI002548EB4C|nr:zinc-binding alcohol dehydrogenase-like protein [Penicillium waksmanii]KAJ5988578.1 zinc-binding alcohol dehydrogenase-like protein [Penicillium waksmanii]
MPPKTSPAWILSEQKGIDSLQLVQDNPIPEVGEYDVLVKIHAASLNYRDIVVAKGEPALPYFRPGVIPGSDGAGTVRAVGANVNGFQVGDRVCTHLTSGLPANQPTTMVDICQSGLGHSYDGTLAAYAVLHETALVPMPANLDFIQASTLTCSGLTAWNALFGIDSLKPKKGDWVLVQGTGGVSIAALQFALAAGATIIATTSSNAKADRLKFLGAHHVLNYHEDANWGQTAKNLTPNDQGVNIVLDVGGLSTLTQSLKAVRTDGLIALAGMLGSVPDGTPVPTLMDCLSNSCTVRGFLLGTRDQYREMNRFIVEKGVEPVVDDHVFDFTETKQAYELLQQQRHFSKVCIRI